MTTTPRDLPATSVPAIREEYAGRLEAWRALVEKRTRFARRLGDLRLATFVGAVAVAAAAVLTGAFSPWWALLLLLAFLALVLAHDPARQRVETARRAEAYYQRGLDRLDNCWQGRGVTGSEYLDPDHPCAADLDLFGEGSLFERLCLARTRAGEARLASWLTAPADAAVARERQEAVLELRPQLDLRERLELLGTKERATLEPAALFAWGEAPPAFHGRGLRVLVMLASFANAGALAAWITAGAGILPLIGTALAATVLARTQASRAARALGSLEHRARELSLLAALLECIERQSFSAPGLKRVRARLETSGRPASARIAELARLLHLLETGRNQFFAPFALLFLWRTRFALAVDRWRAQHGPAVREWVEAAAETEALCSLAAWAAENPDAAMPEIIDGEAVFDAADLGHPLLPDDACVRNDVRLGDPVRVLVVSGSNMSGKSTLLRTVGTNAVIAFAGAPVRARRLRISPLVPGATLRIQDSLREGRSRFYAEITRVRQVLDLARGDQPVLFLFDEIFHGTNSSDRRIGAEAVLRSLVRSGAIGLATTHDLALADVADALGPAALNVHFADTLVDGELRFDYRMKPGVVRHSNALALMRSVGLEV
jgi:hypothetical protein